MTSSAQFNSLPLLSVKPALDEALNRVGNALEQYFAGDAQNAALLQEAAGESHRANAVLRMLSLDGALVFCGEIEKLLGEFAADTLRPSPMHHEVLQRARGRCECHLIVCGDHTGRCLRPLEGAWGLHRMRPGGPLALSNVIGQCERCHRASGS